jgi:CelD/BcsL family acetyltransferase involved in cellulose biosynthesis
MLGYQYLDCYYYIDVGYDPAYANFSVGSVLQLMVLKDLYTRGTLPAIFDFSTGYGAHKARFGNFAQRQVNLLLLPKTLDNHSLALAFRWTERASAALVSALDKLGLKKRLKKWIRQFASRARD